MMAICNNSAKIFIMFLTWICISIKQFEILQNFNILNIKIYEYSLEEN